VKPTIKCKQTGGKGRGELKFGGTYQLLVYDDSVNLLGESCKAKQTECTTKLKQKDKKQTLWM
jgi:hypothetical protein